MFSLFKWLPKCITNCTPYSYIFSGILEITGTEVCSQLESGLKVLGFPSAFPSPTIYGDGFCLVMQGYQKTRWPIGCRLSCTAFVEHRQLAHSMLLPPLLNFISKYFVLGFIYLFNLWFWGLNPGPQPYP
jgi:hypothetical protein